MTEINESFVFFWGSGPLYHTTGIRACAGLGVKSRSGNCDWRSCGVYYSSLDSAWRIRRHCLSPHFKGGSHLSQVFAGLTCITACICSKSDIICSAQEDDVCCSAAELMSFIISQTKSLLRALGRDDGTLDELRTTAFSLCTSASLYECYLDCWPTDCTALVTCHP